MPQSFRRNAMKIAKVPVVTPVSRQLNLLFDARCPAGLSSPEWSKVRQLLAQILMQAAGLSVEELGDDDADLSRTRPCSLRLKTIN
jgi:hypothetical protein